MSTLSKHERCRKAQQKLQHVLDNLLKLSTDCDIRRLVEVHNIKSVLDLMNLCLYNDWGRDLDITTSVSRPILEDQRMLFNRTCFISKVLQWPVFRWVFLCLGGYHRATVY